MSIFNKITDFYSKIRSHLPPKMQTVFDKVLNYETVSYLIFGVLTTVVSIASYAAVLYMMCGGENPTKLQMNTATGISWILAVTFAYLTNKYFVFKSRAANKKALLREISSFFAARIVSLIFEVIWMNLTAVIAGDNYTAFVSSMCKFFAQFVIVVLNYIFSKLFIFKKKEN